MEWFEVPVIDVKDICSDDSNEDFLAKTGKEIVDAAATYGLFAIRNHGISETLISDVHEVSDKFFDLPTIIKEKYIVDETFQQGYHWNKDQDSLKREAYCFHGYKRTFPEEVPDFKRKAESFARSLEQLPKIILKAVDLHLGLDGYIRGRYPEEIEQSCRSCFSLQRYPVPSSTVAEGTVRLHEHTDYSVITLLDTCDGMQIKDHNGSWKTAKFSGDTFVGMFGQAMEIMSSGLIQASVHRVVFTNNEKWQTKPRHCMGYFPLPKDDVMIAPFDGSSKYKPISPIDLFQNVMGKYYYEMSEV